MKQKIIELGFLATVSMLLTFGAIVLGDAAGHVVGGMLFAQQNETRLDPKDFEIIKARAVSWEMLTSLVGDNPLSYIQRQSATIERAAQIVTAHGDSALIQQFKEIGFPVGR